MARAKFCVDAMIEGDWLVRGTNDPMTALMLIVDEADEHWQLEERLYGVASPHEYGEHDPEAVQYMADWCYEMLRRARVGYYRKIHCLPNTCGYDDGWTWQLQYVKGPAHGAFLGVYFAPY